MGISSVRNLAAEVALCGTAVIAELLVRLVEGLGPDEGRLAAEYVSLSRRRGSMFLELRRANEFCNKPPVRH